MLKIQQAAAANNIICSSTWYFFFKEPAGKKKQKIGGKNWRSYYRCTSYTYHIQGRFGQPPTNWRQGRLQKAATTRDRCVVHMCASSVLSRRATSPAPAQRKTAAIFQPHPDGTTKNDFCIRTSMPAEYWYVPRVSYICRNSIPHVVCPF